MWRLRTSRLRKRAAAGALGIGSAVGAAITDRRVLGPAEARVMVGAGLVLGAVSAMAMRWPKVVAIPLAVMLGWVALSLLVRAARLSFQDRGLTWPWRRAAIAPKETRDD